MKTLLPFSAWALVFVFGMAGQGTLTAQQPSGPSGSVLVLDNERILQGEVARQGDQYVIRGTSGELRVPASKALMVCGSLQDAYRFMSSRANLYDGEERLRLARWCQMYGLDEQAVTEAKAALELRPGHAPSRQLLAILQRALEPAPAPPQTDLGPGPADAPVLEVNGDCLALFTTRVQPILINACASCHATGQGGAFVLARPSDAAGRRALQMNLGAAIQQICFEQPSASPLLYKAWCAHGSAVQAALGNRQAPPFQALQAWVQLVAAQHPHLKAHGATAVAAGPLPPLGGKESGVRSPESGVEFAGGPKESGVRSSENGVVSGPLLTSGGAEGAGATPNARAIEMLPSALQAPGAVAGSTPAARAVEMWANTVQGPGVADARPVEIRPSTPPPAGTAAPGKPGSLPVAPTTPGPLAARAIVAQELSGPYDPLPFNQK